MKVSRFGWVWVIVLVAVIWGSGRLRETWQWNWTALHLIKNEDTPISVTDLDCSQIWLTGMVAGQHGDRSAQRQAFVQALGCSPEYLSLIQAVLPKDKDMARLATQDYPESAKAWFWLGEAAVLTDLQETRQAYLHTVSLAPHNGLAWCRLGNNYQQTGELEKATEAYLSCCMNADPGKNGCVNAGRMMEQLGNLKQAIEYYRLSRWEEALKRAQELEALVSP